MGILSFLASPFMGFLLRIIGGWLSKGEEKKEAYKRFLEAVEHLEEDTKKHLNLSDDFKNQLAAIRQGKTKVESDKNNVSEITGDQA